MGNPLHSQIAQLRLSCIDIAILQICVMILCCWFLQFNHNEIVGNDKKVTTSILITINERNPIDRFIHIH